MEKTTECFDILTTPIALITIDGKFSYQNEAFKNLSQNSQDIFNLFPHASYKIRQAIQAKKPFQSLVAVNPQIFPTTIDIQPFPIKNDNQFIVQLQSLNQTQNLIGEMAEHSQLLWGIVQKNGDQDTFNATGDYTVTLTVN